MQFAQELPSSLHWKLESDSLDLNPKLAVVAVVVELGPLVMEVFGGVASVGPWFLGSSREETVACPPSYTDRT